MYVFALGLGRLKDLILQLKINLADGTLLFGQPAPTSYFSLLPFPRYAQIDLAFCEFLRLSPMVVGFSLLEFSSNESDRASGSRCTKHHFLALV
jgi:hypothetical protein